MTKLQMALTQKVKSQSEIRDQVYRLVLNDYIGIKKKNDSPINNKNKSSTYHHHDHPHDL